MSTSKCGKARHFINRRLRSFACRARWEGDTSGRRSTDRGSGRLLRLSSHPAHRYDESVLVASSSSAAPVVVVGDDGHR